MKIALFSTFGVALLVLVLVIASTPSERQKAAAVAQCRLERGSSAKIIWRTDGSLICRAAQGARS